jgi:hypothetical protein
MLGMEQLNTTLVLPLWAIGAAGVLFAVVCLIAVARSGTAIFGSLVRLVVVILVAGAAWVFYDRSAAHDRVTERYALDARAVQLTAQALAPGSALSCLDPGVSETVVAACERDLFATPQSVAAAVSYTAARLALLGDSLDFAARRDPSYDKALASVRQGLETDRFGFLAHVLALRDNCTALQCDALKVLRDPSRVQANLKEGAFDNYLARYSGNWSGRAVSASAPIADSMPLSPVASVPPAPFGTIATPLSSKYSFPSSASIPPVSIMNAEPSGPPAAAATAPPKEDAAQKRRAQRQTQQRSQAAGRAPNRPMPLATQPPADDPNQPRTQ